MNQQKENISRGELYRKVWDEPISTLAASFGVSGSYLARICRELRIPTPGRGYWAQIKVGKQPLKEPLPPLAPGDPSVWIRSGLGSFYTDSRPVPPEIRTEIPILKKSGATHGLITHAKEILSQATKDYSSPYLHPRHRKLAHLLTTQVHLEKTIAFAHKLFTRLEDYGYRVLLANQQDTFIVPQIEREETPHKPDNMYGPLIWWPQSGTVAYFGTVAIGLIIVEMTELVTNEGRYSSSEVGSGRYRLYAYSPYRHTKLVTSWQDTKDLLLTARLDEIIGEMEKMAQTIPSLITEGELRAAEEAAEREEKYKASQKESALKARRETEFESRTKLQKLIEDWSTIRSQRDFLNELNSMLDDLPPEERQEIQSRVDIAKNLLTMPCLLDLIRTWKTPEEQYKALPSWRRYDED